jgi:cyclase
MISRRWVTLGVGVAAAYAMVQAQELHTFHVQGNVYMIVGAGGNVTAQVGNDGVLLVNSGTAENASKLLAEVRKLSKGPIRYLINTDVAPDHVGGNEQGVRSRELGGGRQCHRRYWRTPVSAPPS